MKATITGSLQIKHGKYIMVLNTYVNGKRKQVWRSTRLPVKGNKMQARRMLQDLIREYEQQESQDNLVTYDFENTLFIDELKDWLCRTEPHIDIVTYQGYKNLINAHIEPYFAALGLKIKDIDIKTLQTYFNMKAHHGRIDGKGGLSARSLRQHKTVLYQVLKSAAAKGLIANNPCQYVELPSVERYEANFYTTAQLNQLFALIQDEPIYPLIKTTYVYGLRRSEVLGLKWDCVNFDSETITIRRTVVSVMKTVEKNKTKNRSSHRSFPLTPDIKSLLLTLRNQQEASQKEYGNMYIQNDYVFKWPDGHTFAPDYVTRRFSQILKRHGFPHIRFHDLRHSSASTLLSMGFGLKDVQEWLGHADIRITANTYGHLDIQRKKMLAASICSSFVKES